MNKIINNDKKYILQTYNRYNIIINKGKNAYLYDKNGNKYLDFLAGISVCNLGHCNKQINNSIKKQLDKLIHCSNLYYTEEQIKLAKAISNISFKGKSFFGNSGTEANEAAIKAIRYRGNKINKNHIICLKNSFHGRSSGALALTGQEKHKKGFEPILPNITHIEHNNIKELQNNFNENIAGVILEPIQGESGIHPLSKEFVQEARRLTHKYNALLVFDEIQTGLGRTGEIFAYKHYNIEPDAFTIAKSLANGLPIGAFHINDKYSNTLPPGKHASTFGGNPLVCTAALKVINTLNHKFLNKIKKNSNYLFNKINELKTNFPIITEIRGKGLMIAIEIPNLANQILNLAHKNKLLINTIGNNTIRLLPPLTISKKEINLFYKKMNSILNNIKNL